MFLLRDHAGGNEKLLGMLSSGVTVCGNDDRIAGLNRRVSTNDKIKVLSASVNLCEYLPSTIVQGLWCNYF